MFDKLYNWLMTAYKPVPFQELRGDPNRRLVPPAPLPAVEATQREAVTKLLVTVDEAAKSLSVGRPKMWQLVMSGEVPSIKIGASRRIPVSVLEDYVRQKLAAAEAELVRR
jgi:excisionase family DNA binding protein